MAARTDLDLSRAAWRTSSYSNNGGQCVEVASTQAPAGAGVLVRDTKDRQGPVLEFAAGAWKQFLAEVKAGTL